MGAMAFHRGYVSHCYNRQAMARSRRSTTASLQPEHRSGTTSLLGAQRNTHLAMAEEEPYLRPIAEQEAQSKHPNGQAEYGNDTFKVPYNTLGSLHPEQRRVLLVPQLQVMQQIGLDCRAERANGTFGICQHDALDGLCGSQQCFHPPSPSQLRHIQHLPSMDREVGCGRIDRTYGCLDGWQEHRQ